MRNLWGEGWRTTLSRQRAAEDELIKELDEDGESDRQSGTATRRARSGSHPPSLAMRRGRALELAGLRVARDDKKSLRVAAPESPHTRRPL